MQSSGCSRRAKACSQRKVTLNYTCPGHIWQTASTQANSREAYVVQSFHLASYVDVGKTSSPVRFRDDSAEDLAEHVACRVTLNFSAASHPVLGGSMLHLLLNAKASRIAYAIDFSILNCQLAAAARVQE